MFMFEHWISKTVNPQENESGKNVFLCRLHFASWVGRGSVCWLEYVFFWGGGCTVRERDIVEFVEFLGWEAFHLPNVTLSVFLEQICLLPFSTIGILNPNPGSQYRSQRKVMLSQVSVCPLGEGVGYLWFQVPSRCLVPCSLGGGG